ncbi:MAG: hypothetical protein KKA71_04410, partial [Proteobacteria bacterium]|nr:hypothetical protein [Pseudomonadota bacterium]
KLIISSSHKNIRQILQNTPYVNSWARLLRRIEGAEDIANCRFEYGCRTRAVSIPLIYVFGEEEAD